MSGKRARASVESKMRCMGVGIVDRAWVQRVYRKIGKAIRLDGRRHVKSGAIRWGTPPQTRFAKEIFRQVNDFILTSAQWASFRPHLSPWAEALIFGATSSAFLWYAVTSPSRPQ